MKLLFDHNLSPRLCRALADLWPDATHVRNVGLHTADDPVIWEHASTHDLTIVSKDSDFNNLSLLLGAPPKVICIQLGNCSTRNVEHVLRARHTEVQAFAADANAALLVIGPD